MLSLLQICQQLAKKSIWQLRSGAVVGLKDGCFLQVFAACIAIESLLYSRRLKCRPSEAVMMTFIHDVMTSPNEQHAFKLRLNWV